MEADNIDLTMSRWELLDVNNFNKLLIKFDCQKSCYQIALCDLSLVFIEEMSSENIQVRSKSINKRLEAPTENIVSHIKQSLLQHHNLKFSYTKQSDMEIHLSFSNSFHSGIPFCWTFVCVHKTYRNGSANKMLLLDPLILTISHLLCENNMLKEVVKQKDEEIKDYRDSGYKVSRSHLKTNLFDAETFQNDLKTSQDYALSITQDLMKVISSTDVNNLLVSTSIGCSSADILNNLHSVCSKESLSKNVSLSQSPNKKRVLQKPKPAVRGCVLDADTDSNDKFAEVSHSGLEPVPKRKQKKVRKKPLF